MYGTADAGIHTGGRAREIGDFWLGYGICEALILHIALNFVHVKQLLVVIEF